MPNISPPNLVLIGNPNCGKTTLFNQLTKSNQKVGNWPGVTVEKKQGRFSVGDQGYILTDLPGIYSLEQKEAGLDELIARDYLACGDIDLIINIVDATQLERQLMLTSQLLSTNLPMILVINILDEAEKQGIQIDFSSLSKKLGIPVLGIVAAKSLGLSELSTLITNHALEKRHPLEIKGSISHLVKQRVEWISDTLDQTLRQDQITPSLSEKLDNIVLNRWLGIPVFLLTMYLMFTIAVNIGSIFIDFFDILFGAIFVDGTAYLLNLIGAPIWLVTLLADGVGGGIQLVATFVPVIGFLYLCLSILESSGYIARAAFVVDRLMSAIGLPGKAFVPLIVGFGCNVPSIMACRTLNRNSDRMITIAMAPFMSCGARLAVFALFAAVIFEEQGQNIIFVLYLIGIAMAILTGLLFRYALPKEPVSSTVMELPPYRLPILRNIYTTTWQRLSGFIQKAGKTIVLVFVALSFINSIGIDGSFGNQNSERSVLAFLGKAITPALAPIGVQQENWPAAVGIFTGIFAKEAVVGTLDALYSGTSENSVAEVDRENSQGFKLSEAIEAAFGSIADNAAGLKAALTDPLGLEIESYDSMESVAEGHGTSETGITMMQSHFPSSFAAFCYLVLILLYTPCLAAMGALVREAGQIWGWIVAGWSSLLAYSTAVIIYQTGTFMSHALSSSLWIVAMLSFVASAIYFLRWYGRSDKQSISLITMHAID